MDAGRALEVEDTHCRCRESQAESACVAGADLADGRKYIRGRHAHRGVRPHVYPCPLVISSLHPVLHAALRKAFAATCETPRARCILRLMCPEALHAWGAMRSCYSSVSRALRPLLATAHTELPSGLTISHAELLPAHRRHSPASARSGARRRLHSAQERRPQPAACACARCACTMCRCSAPLILCKTSCLSFTACRSADGRLRAGRRACRPRALTPPLHAVGGAPHASGGAPH